MFGCVWGGEGTFVKEMLCHCFVLESKAKFAL